MEKEQLCEKILEMEVEYYNEMMAEGAWGGHAYAPEYFKGFRDCLITLVADLREVMGESYLISSCSFALSTDYDQLISKVYNREIFTVEETEDIADALSAAFKNKMDKVMGNLAELYTKLSGRAFEKDFESALKNFKKLV